jgi:hypothetical protein
VVPRPRAGKLAHSSSHFDRFYANRILKEGHFAALEQPKVLWDDVVDIIQKFGLEPSK